MKTNETEEIISRRFAEISKICTKIKRNFSADDIHKFRTDIKKMRAFIRLATFVPDAPANFTLPKKIKKLYAAAGDIRDYQLQVERVKSGLYNENFKLSEYLMLLKEKIKKGKKKLKRLVSRKMLASVEKKIKRTLPDSLNMQNVNDFAKQKIAQIEILRKIRSKKDDDIHSIRKNLKDVMYAVQMIDSSLRPTFPKAFYDIEEKKKAERLSEQLGMFTDLSAAVLFTEPRFIDEVCIAERTQLMQLRMQWLQKKNEVKKEVLRELKQINSHTPDA